MSNVWSSALRLLEQYRYVPTESLESLSPREVSKRSPKDGVTLFEIIRLASGTQWAHREWADTSFWNWSVLRESWKSVWAFLDNGLLEMGTSDQPAVVWAFQRERSQEDVHALLNFCANNFDPIPIPQPEPRPEARLMVGLGKLPAALANTIAVIRHGTDVSYGDLISSTIQDVSSDEDLLRKLDALVTASDVDRTKTEDQTLIPRLLVRCKIEQERSTDHGTYTFISFIETIDKSSNLEGISDSALQRRLSQLAPERNATAQKFLDKSLTY